MLNKQTMYPCGNLQHSLWLMIILAPEEIQTIACRHSSTNTWV